MRSFDSCPWLQSLKEGSLRQTRGGSVPLEALTDAGKCLVRRQDELPDEGDEVPTGVASLGGTRLDRALQGVPEVLPLVVAQGPHQVAGGPRLDAVVRKTAVVERGVELGEFGAHRGSPSWPTKRKRVSLNDAAVH